MFRVVIPARFESSRLPGKVLLMIGGRPMLHWVCDQARACGAAQVVVATDDERIEAAARQAGVECVRTSPRHLSGTDRIAETVRRLGWAPEELVVNLQGDEPLMPPVLIRQVAQLLVDHPDADIATLASPVTSASEFLDPNAVKVVLDEEGRAMLFSRAPIPWDRDGAIGGVPGPDSHFGALRHIGLYAYRVRSLLRVAQLPPGQLELREKLEQLRALAHGMQIRVAIAQARPGVDVNTPEDLVRIRAVLEAPATN
ncbi:MAG TPA: 3-deoxy-manno-octulosonate cytidylyltransferase [Steroidobacteraceae bacterium]|nr:3-deoxy-manno-octulosonate cytidylyltransferase [Steroidobacteraceae bacterium]